MAHFYRSHEGQPLEFGFVPMRIRNLANSLGSRCDGPVHASYHWVWCSQRHGRWGGSVPDVQSSDSRAEFAEIIRSNNTSGPKLTIDDMDSAFVHHCVILCNTSVLELRVPGAEKRLLALYIRRLFSTREIPVEECEIQAFRQTLKAFALNGMVLERALKIISEGHLSGMNVLFGDTAERLASRNKFAQEMCDHFNELVNELGASFCEAEPITSDELEEAMHTGVPREVDNLLSLARASADLRFGSGLNVCRLLSPIFDE